MAASYQTSTSQKKDRVIRVGNISLMIKHQHIILIIDLYIMAEWHCPASYLHFSPPNKSYLWKEAITSIPSCLPELQRHQLWYDDTYHRSQSPSPSSVLRRRRHRRHNSIHCPLISLRLRSMRRTCKDFALTQSTVQSDESVTEETRLGPNRTCGGVRIWWLGKEAKGPQAHF